MKTQQKTDKKKKKKLSAEERRRRLKKLMQSIGWGNIHIGNLAKEWGVNRSAIYDDRDALLKAFKKEDIEHISFKLGINYEKAIEEAQKILSNPENSPIIKLKAIQALNDTQDKYTRFLEAYGRKEKVAEKIEYEDPAAKLYEKLFKDKQKSSE